ncbi:hypothetical protein AAEX67_004684 [Yersinia enterocolitica]
MRVPAGTLFCVWRSVVIEHNVSLPAPLRTGSARKRRQPGKTGSKLPTKPRIPSQINFTRLHSHAAG